MSDDLGGGIGSILVGRYNDHLTLCQNILRAIFVLSSLTTDKHHSHTLTLSLQWYTGPGCWFELCF